MANLTFNQFEGFVRAYFDALDNSKVGQQEVLIWCSLAQRKVQQDINNLGIKKFIKTSYNTGGEFLEPSDISNLPNAIVDMLASSSSTRASGVYGGANPNRITYFYLQPGTAGNGILINHDSGTYGTPASGVQCVLAGGTFYIDYASGQTYSQIAAALNADPLFSQYFNAASTSSNIPSQSQVNITLAGGSGTGWAPAIEISIENYIRQPNNPYLAPSAAEPKYCLYGVATGARLIRFLPNNITYSMMTYRYRLANVALTGSLSVPEEFEELVILEVSKKMGDKLGLPDKVKEFEAKYAEQLGLLQKSYQDLLGGQVQEKVRLVTTGEGK